MREQLRIAVANLRANRARTLLTTLGIVIGVASITLVLALGEGVRQAVSAQVDRLNGNVIIVKPGSSDVAGITAFSPYNTALTTTLTERDFNSVKTLEGIRDIAPVMMLSGSIRTDSGDAANVPILATSESLTRTLGLTVRSGQFIDSGTSRDTVVLGQQLAINLFGTDQARGQSIQVKGRPHTVIGVVKNTKTPINLSGINLDQA
ncbi:MAG: ABC transporter permease, partial [Candidatus Saccharimonadales bacterium]